MASYKDPDEGLELRPEIIERLKKSQELPRSSLLTLDEVCEKLEVNHAKGDTEN